MNKSTKEESLDLEAQFAEVEAEYEGIVESAAKVRQMNDDDHDSQGDAIKKAIPQTIKLKETLLYNGKEYTELSFAWSKVRGSDLVNISRAVRNIPIYKAEINVELTDEYAFYLARVACEQPLGSDFMDYLSVCDYQRIKNLARNYFFVWCRL